MFGWNKLIVFFVTDGNAILALLKCKECDQIILHKLRGNRTTDQLWELRGTKSEILFNLDNTELVATALRLNWKDILCATLINAYINLIGFNLSHIRNSCPKMILK